MDQRMKQLLGVLTLVLVVTLAACTQHSSAPPPVIAPTDAEVIKAITDSGVLSAKGFSVTEPVVIMERGQRNADGDWPVKVKLQITMKEPHGGTRHLVSTPTFKIYQSIDGSGNKVWKAKW